MPQKSLGVRCVWYGPLLQCRILRVWIGPGSVETKHLALSTGTTLQITRRLLLLIVALLPALAARAAQVDFAIRAQHGNGATVYSGDIYPFLTPSDPDIPYITGQIASTDHQFLVTSVEGGWLNHSTTFYSSLTDLVAALEQPFEILLDEGLSSERRYSMNLNLGDLSTSGLAPPTVYFPAFNGQIDSLTPTFLYSLETAGYYHGDLFHFDGSTGVFDTRATLVPGSSSFTPSLTLIRDREYFLDIYNTDVYLPGLGFSTPVDANDNPIANWQSRGDGIAETNVSFTAVPEPASLCILALGSIALIVFRRRPR
jgi:hypothetical protein